MRARLHPHQRGSGCRYNPRRNLGAVHRDARLAAIRQWTRRNQNVSPSAGSYELSDCRTVLASAMRLFGTFADPMMTTAVSKVAASTFFTGLS
jgi:hypothetical protein